MTIFLPHADPLTSNSSLNQCVYFEIHGVILDSKFSSQKQICFVLASAAQKIDLL